MVSVVYTRTNRETARAPLILCLVCLIQYLLFSQCANIFVLCFEQGNWSYAQNERLSDI